MSKRICDMKCFECKLPDCINDYVKPEPSEAQRWYRRERDRERREECRKQGICTQCKKRPARIGRVMCEECTERVTQSNRKRVFFEREARKYNEQCYFCGAPRKDGYRVCASCYERCRKNTPTTRARNKRGKDNDELRQVKNNAE